MGRKRKTDTSDIDISSKIKDFKKRQKKEHHEIRKIYEGIKEIEDFIDQLPDIDYTKKDHVSTIPLKSKKKKIKEKKEKLPKLKRKKIKEKKEKPLKAKKKKIKEKKEKPLKAKKKKEKVKKKLSTPKKIAATGTAITIVLLLFIFVIVPTMQGSIHFLIVLSGSMAPEVNPGDIVVSTKINPEEIKINDIITFRHSEAPDQCVTHRVINITNVNGNLSFQTKGDANQNPDLRFVPSSEIVGKMSINLPYLGYLPVFAQSPLGFLTFIIVPGILIIIYEVFNIFKTRKEESEKESRA